MLFHTRSGAGTRVVLVHGLTQTHRSWSWPPLAGLAAGHEVVAVDAPGHGGSAGVRADLWQGAELLGQAGDRAAYLGYSMGARLSLHLALARPDLVRCLVLVGATAGIADPAARAARRAADEERAAELERHGLGPFLERWLAQPLFAGLRPPAIDRAARSTNTVAGLASSLRLAGTGTQEPLQERLGALDMPVLLVAGENDAAFAARATSMAAAIGPNARVALVPGAGHAAHLERPQDFVALVAPFLDDRHDRRPHRPPHG